MALFDSLASRISLGHKRKLLAQKEEWACMLEDQIDSGRAVLSTVRADILKLRAELFAAEDPVDILRRAGV